LNDKSSEGNWYWENGIRANTDDDSLWYQSRPITSSSATTRDCGMSYFDRAGRHDAFFALDVPCTDSHATICEKTIEM